MGEKMNQQEIENLRHTYTHGQLMESLKQNQGWLIVAEILLKRIKDFELNKLTIPYTIFVDGQIIRDASGVIVGKRSGQELLMEFIKEEATINAYRDLLALIEADVQLGKEAESSLKKYINDKK